MIQCKLQSNMLYVDKQGNNYPITKDHFSGNLAIVGGAEPPLTIVITNGFSLTYLPDNPIYMALDNGEQQKAVCGNIKVGAIPQVSFQVYNHAYEYARKEPYLLTENDIKNANIAPFTSRLTEDLQSMFKDPTNTQNWELVSNEDAIKIGAILNAVDPLDILLDNEIILDLTELRLY